MIGYQNGFGLCDKVLVNYFIFQKYLQPYRYFVYCWDLFFFDHKVTLSFGEGDRYLTKGKYVDILSKGL